MTDNHHPITPPPELVEQWECEYHHSTSGSDFAVFISEKAARWGADQELEACSQWIHGWYGNGSREVVGNLYAARRPKPPSLKEQALAALAAADGADHPVVATVITADQHDIIRRALELLPS